MASSRPYLNAAEAARRLGISTKALRLYEKRGLISPRRTAAGWRVYGPAEMERAAEIVALRGLGLALGQIADVFKRDATCLESALASHQSDIEGQIRALADRLERVRAIRSDIAASRAPALRDLARLVHPILTPSIAFDLPWPWGGERFELSDIKPVNYIIGPLGSGKTRLARAIAAAASGAIFAGLDRLEDDAASARKHERDPEFARRVDNALSDLVGNGAVHSPALVSLVVALEDLDATMLVIDMVEQGLDPASQRAVASYLRHRSSGAPPLFMLTRSSEILDLANLPPDAAIILCPANHSPPLRVAPYAGAPGYEAVATCLAPPDVRARTAGMIAYLPGAA